MAEILINSDSRYLINRSRIRHALQTYLDTIGISRKVEVSIAVVGSRKMKELNKKYRQLEKATNVLSFPLESFDLAQDKQAAGFVSPDDGKLYLGDIVLCYPFLRQEAGKHKLMVDDWIDELAVHGLEHLLGKHHE